MDCIAGARNVVLRTSWWRVGSWLGCGPIGGRPIRRSCLSGRYHAAIVPCARLGSRSDWRLALVHRSPQLSVSAGSLHMLRLSGHRRHVSLMRRRFLLRRWAPVDPPVAAVVADAVHGVVDHRCVVNVVNLGDVDVGHRAVIKEPSVVPTSTFEALAEVTEAVINPAVETYLRTPVALMEEKSVAFPSPIARGPEKANFRS